MPRIKKPSFHDQWRDDRSGREEDAATLFGYYLVKHCREEAMSTITLPHGSPEHAIAVKAVETALFNVIDLLEGFWPLKAGPGKQLSLALHVQVMKGEKIVEDVPVSPGIDLPIGYWGWVDDFGTTPRADA